MNALADFLSHEAGQRRRNWLDSQSARAGNALSYYLGPTGIDQKLNALAQALWLSDAGDVAEAADASQALWNDPSMANAGRYATAAAAMMIPAVSARMANAGGDVLGDALASGADDVRRFVGDESGHIGPITAYHASPNTFDEFRPSEFRGATFFAPTPKGAKAGASASRNEYAMSGAGLAGDAPQMNIYEASIDGSKISGLTLTPDEMRAFRDAPDIITSEAALNDFQSSLPGNLDWEMFYEAQKVGDRQYQYVKRSAPPDLSYEEAQRTNRNIYGRMFGGYDQTGDEAKTARRILDEGMGGWIVNDEGGLSIAVADPSAMSVSRVIRPDIRAAEIQSYLDGVK